MIKTELLEAIKNGESVWLVFEDRIYKLDKSKIIDINDCYVEYYNNYYRCNLYATISDFYETEARAKHFISHCGVTRTETLPFLTWDEFLKERHLSFIGKNEIEYMLCIFGDKIDLAEHRACSSFVIKEWHATEANFYKAYDECVRLFKEQ